MGQMISKPDANPVVLAVCNLFVGGALGYYLMGQTKKAIIALIICWGVPMISCGFCTPLILAVWVFAYDAYLLGQKLQSGQSIGMNENGLDFLNAIFKD